MILHVIRAEGAWHWSVDATPSRPDPLSRGYDSRREATYAAVSGARSRAWEIDYITGHADRKVCGELRIKFRSPGHGARPSWPQQANPRAEASHSSQDGHAPAPLSMARLTALAAARSKRQLAAARRVPEGFRSLEHFLDSIRETAAARSDGIPSLARYLGVNPRSVRKWLSREKRPLQDTINSMALWRSTRLG